MALRTAYKITAYNKNLLVIFRRLLLLLGVYAFMRFYFLFLNADYFNNLTLPETLKIFLAGMRFDISAIFWVNLLYIVANAIPGKFKYTEKFQFGLKIFFIATNGVAIFADLGDAQFFRFEEKRTNADIFTPEWLGDDFLQLLPQFMADFWHVPLTLLIVLLILWRIYPPLKSTNTAHTSKNRKEITLELFVSLVFAGIVLLGIRGGIQLKPISVVSATKYTHLHNIPLVLNTPFSIIRTIGKLGVKPISYFEENQLNKIFTPQKSYSSGKSGKSDNVVIIILESFGNEYVGFMNPESDYSTPFLDSLCKRSLVFKRAFANGKRSIEALPSILASFPALMNDAFITSKYSTNNINSLGALLAKRGYHTSFFHGGKNGTMSFDSFIKISGMDNYFGKNEYNNDSDYDGHWGIYDEPYLTYFADKLTQFPEPFCTSVFTLSSHHPYAIPKQYEGKFPKGKFVNTQSIAYTDYALKKFFEKASKLSWYEHTLFVITADHTAQAYADFYKNKTGKYAVPIIFYHPTDTSLIGESNRVAQQADILPSILDYLEYKGNFTAFGNSVFEKNTESFAVNYMNGVYQIIMDEYSLLYDGEKTLGLYNYLSDVRFAKNVYKDSTERARRMEKKLKAIIQTYNNSLIRNSLVKK